MCVCARVYAEDGLVGKRTRPFIYPPLCCCAVLARLRRWTRFWPQVRHASPTAAHPSPPPPPGQHARVIGRVRVIPPNAAPSSMRLLVALIYAVYQFTSSSCSVPRNTPLAGSPQPPVCDAPLARPSFATPASGAAASTHSELRHALHTTRTRPPGTHAAHGQISFWEELHAVSGPTSCRSDECVEYALWNSLGTPRCFSRWTVHAETPPMQANVSWSTGQHVRSCTSRPFCFAVMRF